MRRAASNIYFYFTDVLAEAPKPGKRGAYLHRWRLDGHKMHKVKDWIGVRFVGRV